MTTQILQKFLRAGLRVAAMSAAFGLDAFASTAFASPDALIRQQLGQRVLAPEKARSSSDAVFAAVEAGDQACDAHWRALRTKEAFFAYGRQLRERMIAGIGGFPTDAEKTPLNPVITATVPRDGYRIEKLYFESWPGVHVPANLFIPNDLRPGERRAAIVVSCGHTGNGKGADAYQRACVLAVKAGFVVLIFDPFAQGERIVGGGRCERHNTVGALATLLGGSMARYRIWDAKRALDYLETRPEVDPTRFGFMGQSGGGTMTALMMSVEPRVKAACPCCFISRYADSVRDFQPGDAEQNIFGMLPAGVNYTSMILMQAPLAVRILTTHDDIFPFAGSVKTMKVVDEVAGRFGLGARYDMVSVDGKHSWQESERVAAAEWMRRWVMDDPKALRHDLEGYRALDRDFCHSKVDIGLSAGGSKRLGAETVCPRRNVRNLPGDRTLFDLMRDDLKAAEAARPAGPVSSETVRRLAGMGELLPQGYARREIARESFDGLTIVREAFVKPDGFELPAVTFIPQTATGGVTVVIGEGSRDARQAVVAEKLAQGRTVTALDLFATGEIRAFRHRFYGNPEDSEEVAVLLYALGRSLVGVRAEELGQVLRALNAQDVEVAALGRLGIVAAHAQRAYPGVGAKVDLRQPPNSWANSVRKAEVIPFAATVFGALNAYDWPDLLGASCTY